LSEDIPQGGPIHWGRIKAAAEPGPVLVTANVQRQVAGLFVAEEQGARDLKGVHSP
jgi:hypothetical protein